MHVRTLVAAALALGLLSAGPARAHDVVVFGDSWAAGAADELGSVLSSRGHADITVDGRGVAGTTAELWASQPNALPDAVSLNPDARWVWLSIGGNDVFGHYASGAGAAAAADNDRNIRTMLDALFARHPAIKVVMFGYDFPNFEQSQDCIAQAWSVFGVGTLTPTVNQIFLDDIAAVQSAIAADYPNVTYVPNVWGTLQAAGGVAGAPNVLLPSPSQYMADCIHANHQGYLLVHGALYDAYWGRPAPSASIAVPAGPHCVGDEVVLRDTSSGAASRSWTVDGGAAGSGATVTLQLTVARTWNVALTVTSGAWDDGATASVTAEGPPPVTIDGPVAVVAGSRANYVAEGGAAQLEWSVTGGVLESASGTLAIVQWGAAGEGNVHLRAESAGGCAVDLDRAVTIRAASCGDGLADGAPCDDGDACTADDACLGAECGGRAVACDDGDPCTDDVCDPATGCGAVFNDAPCDDRDPCTEARCQQGSCVAVGLAAGCCDTDADCAGPFEACDTAERACRSVLCLPCEVDADCGPVGNRCLELPSGRACGVDCSGEGALCPVDFVCAAVDADRQCAPVAGDCDCAPEFARACRDGALVWLDSCGRPGATLTDCAGRGCVEADCCPEGTEERAGVCETTAIAEPPPIAEPPMTADAGSTDGGGVDSQPSEVDSQQSTVDSSDVQSPDAVPDAVADAGGVDSSVVPSADAVPDAGTVLDADAVPDAGADGDPTGVGGADGGCTTAGDGRPCTPGGAGLLLGLALFLLVTRVGGGRRAARGA